MTKDLSIKYYCLIMAISLFALKVSGSQESPAKRALTHLSKLSESKIFDFKRIETQVPELLALEEGDQKFFRQKLLLFPLPKMETENWPLIEIKNDDEILNLEFSDQKEEFFLYNHAKISLSNYSSFQEVFMDIEKKIELLKEQQKKMGRWFDIFVKKAWAFGDVNLKSFSALSVSLYALYREESQIYANGWRRLRKNFEEGPHRGKTVWFKGQGKRAKQGYLDQNLGYIVEVTSDTTHQENELIQEH